VLCEKPMAPTISACRTMQRGAEDADRKLSIAENYRRDPISRLAQALVAAGAIGELRSVLDLTARGASRGDAGTWRYLRSEGGPILESGVHDADMQIYLCGPVRSLTGHVRLNERERIYKDVPPKAFHDHYAHTYPETQIADAPDMLMASMEFEGSALGQWLYDNSTHGPSLRRFTLFGSEGQLDLPGVRNGQPLRLYRDGHDGALTDQEVLAFVPEHALDARTARLFGGERLSRYENTGGAMGGSADLKLLAVELGELLDAVDGSGEVEVGPEEGLAAVAVVIACHESSAAARTVAIEEVLNGELATYQSVANSALGLEA
jgi:predicted dehydrogenase